MFGTARDGRFGIARPKIVRDGTFFDALFSEWRCSLPDLAPELLRFFLGG